MDNTRTVLLWLNNDEPLYRQCQQIARKASSNYEAGQAIREMLEESKPELSGLYSDLLNNALQNVEWPEVGADFYEDEEPEESEDDQNED